MGQPSKFWDKIAEKYAETPIADEESYQKKLEVTQGYLKPDMEVLEIGCGTGTTALIHAPHVNHILATDLSPKMIEIAQEKAAAEGIGNVTFKVAAVHELGASGQTYDVVMAHSLLHLLEDMDRAIARVHRLLKPGGLFISSTACLGDSAYRYIGLVAPLGRALGFFPYFRIFTRKELEDSIAEAGFAIDYNWRPSEAKAVFIVARKMG